MVCIEQDRDWYEKLSRQVPAGVELHWVPAAADGRSPSAEAVERILERLGSSVDVAVIDGIGRRDFLLGMVFRHLSSTGAVIADNSHGYGLAEEGMKLGLSRVDCYGFRSGVLDPSVTSIFFKKECFLFDARWPVVDPSRTGLL